MSSKLPREADAETCNRGGKGSYLSFQQCHWVVEVDVLKDIDLTISAITQRPGGVWEWKAGKWEKKKRKKKKKRPLLLSRQVIVSVSKKFQLIQGWLGFCLRITSPNGAKDDEVAHGQSRTVPPPVTFKFIFGKGEKNITRIRKRKWPTSRPV